MAKKKIARRVTGVKKPTKKQWATAYHEAGHAVIARYLHVGFKNVTVVPGEDYFGKLVLKRERARQRAFQTAEYEVTPRRRDAVKKEIIILLGGPYAQMRFNPRCRVQDVESTDIDNAMKLVSYLVGSEHQHKAYWVYMEACVKDLLSMHWKEIEAVAIALIEKRTLSEDDVKKIYQQTIIGPEVARLEARTKARN